MFGGRSRARTYDPLLVRQMLSQLSYTPALVPSFLVGTFMNYIDERPFCQLNFESC